MAYYPPYQSQYFPQQQNNGLIWIQGEQAAKSYLIAPNTTVLLMDSESSRFYLKSSDASGMPTLRVFEYKETTQSDKAQPDLSGFATKAELDAFRTEIQGILRNIAKPAKEEEIVDA